MKENIVAYFDGGITKNPGGQMSISYLIENKNIAVKKNIAGEVKTCNVSEFEALIELLKELKKYKKEQIIIYGDSQLIIDGINKNWKFKKSPHLLKLFEQTKELKSKFNNLNIIWLPREKNKADKNSYLR